MLPTGTLEYLLLDAPSKKLADIRGKYSGQRIFLIGNGPSLAYTDLELLQDEYTFGMNSISLLYNRTTWRPKFYFCISSNVRFETRPAIFKASIDLGIPSFLSTGFKGIVEETPQVYWIHSPRLRDSVDELPIPVWSEDVSRLVGRCGTSMFCVVQIALYMGFKELYLVGCDLGWKGVVSPNEEHHSDPEGGDVNHFTREYSHGVKWITDGGAGRIDWEMRLAHCLINQIVEQKETKVYNATLGGNLETYERVRLEDVV